MDLIRIQKKKSYLNKPIVGLKEKSLNYVFSFILKQDKKWTKFCYGFTELYKVNTKYQIYYRNKNLYKTFLIQFFKNNVYYVRSTVGITSI